jgi:UDP-glucose 4-epimerase
MKQEIRAVVTGGAGFIGSHIAEELLERGHQVCVIDDLSSGKLSNVIHLLPKNLQFIRGSITDLNLLNKTFSGIDYVFHQAAIASVPSSIDNPLAAHDANLTGTLNVLLAARDNKVKKVICASSCAVYGNEPTIPKREDMLTYPQSPYAITKLAAEHYCEVFHQVYGLPTVCLRYFNVYGPRQSPNSQYAAVIPNFIQRIFSKQPPVIFGDGEQTRDFIYVRDVVTANLLAAQSNVIGTFNIGLGKRISLNQLARLIITLLDETDIEPVFEKARMGDIRHSLADIAKAQLFGYRPKYDIQKGIIETIRSYQNNTDWNYGNWPSPQDEITNKR